MSRNTISKYDDVIDSRDVIARIEDLRDELETVLAGHGGDAEAAYAATGTDYDRDTLAELVALERLAEEASGYAPDWEHGETLIRDSYFQTYAEELAEDIGAVTNDLPWPQNCIDWERAARELQMDYTAVEFDGVTYWIR